MPAAQILIVEDERIIAAELTRRITRLGYDVIATAGSGPEALKQARASCPDLVLMDIGLPGEMNGLEAGARIWEELKIPIVYVTAYADELTMTQARTPQPVLAVRKPFDVSQLRSTLEQALTGPR
jgi:CheY-like chemotaxis protein